MNISGEQFAADQPAAGQRIGEKRADVPGDHVQRFVLKDFIDRQGHVGDGRASSDPDVARDEPSAFDACRASGRKRRFAAVFQRVASRCQVESQVKPEKRRFVTRIERSVRQSRIRDPATFEDQGRPGNTPLR